jgi:hypothetical protein
MSNETPVTQEMLDGLDEMAGTCAVKGPLLRQLIAEIRKHRASAAKAGEPREFKGGQWTYPYEFLEAVQKAMPIDDFAPSMEGVELALLGYEKATGTRLHVPQSAAPGEVKPDCAPSPEQQGAEQQFDSFFAMYPPKPAAVLRTAPAPALGLSEDELEALDRAANRCRQSATECKRLSETCETVWMRPNFAKAGEADKKAEATLRSMLERGGAK